MHKGTAYPGEHEAIIDRTLWDKVHAILKESPRKRAANARAQTPALLKGLIFGPNGTVDVADAHPQGRRSTAITSARPSSSGLASSRAITSESRPARSSAIVIGQVRRLVASPEVVVATWKAARETTKGITEAEVREKLVAFEPLWDELFPIEQARIVEQLVERVRILPDRVDVVLRIEGFSSLLGELGQTQELEAA